MNDVGLFHEAPAGKSRMS